MNWKGQILNIQLLILLHYWCHFQGHASTDICTHFMTFRSLENYESPGNWTSRCYTPSVLMPFSETCKHWHLHSLYDFQKEALKTMKVLETEHPDAILLWYWCHFQRRVSIDIRTHFMPFRKKPWKLWKSWKLNIQMLYSFWYWCHFQRRVSIDICILFMTFRGCREQPPRSTPWVSGLVRHFVQTWPDS